MITKKTEIVNMSGPPSGLKPDDIALRLFCRVLRRRTDRVTGLRNGSATAPRSLRFPRSPLFDFSVTGPSATPELQKIASAETAL